MGTALDDVDAVLDQTRHVDESVPPATLHAWRNDLVRASVHVSYALSVLTLDAEILRRALDATRDDVLQTLVEDLPDILATGWVGGGWSLSPDASASVAAAAELAMDETDGLLALHAHVTAGDFTDRDALSALIVEVDLQSRALRDRRALLEARIRHVQDVMRHHFATGAASTDDWLE